MTTLATCWKITRRDTTVLGFTDHDAPLTVGATTYEPTAGYVPSSIDRNTGLSADNLQLAGVIDSVEISDGDLRNGLYTGARVEIFTVDWTNPAAGAVSVLHVGHLGEVSITGSQYTATLLSLENELRKPALRIVSAQCDADLGDTRCGFTLLTDTGSVTSVSEARRVFIDTSRTEADGHYNGGLITWTSGANNGRSMDVKRYVSATDTIELYEPLPDDIAVSDNYNITRGCDKTFATCVNTFANGDNFRGFPHVPGVSDLLGGGT